MQIPPCKNQIINRIGLNSTWLLESNQRLDSNFVILTYDALFHNEKNEVLKLLNLTKTAMHFNINTMLNFRDIPRHSSFDYVYMFVCMQPSLIFNIPEGSLAFIMLNLYRAHTHSTHQMGWPYFHSR